MNFLQKLRDFILHPTNSRTMGILVMLVLISAVSLTVIVAQQQQSIKQKAAGLEQCPAPTNFSCSLEGGPNTIMGSWTLVPNQAYANYILRADDDAVLGSYYSAETSGAYSYISGLTQGGKYYLYARLNSNGTGCTTPSSWSDTDSCTIPTPTPTKTPTPTPTPAPGQPTSTPTPTPTPTPAPGQPTSTPTLPPPPPLPPSHCQKFDGYCNYYNIGCEAGYTRAPPDQDKKYGCDASQICCLPAAYIMPTPTPVNNALLVLTLNAQDMPTATDLPLSVDLALYSLTTNNLVADAPKTQSFVKRPIPGKQYSANISLTNLQQDEYFIVARKDNMLAKAVFTVSKANETITVPTTTLVFGDINNDSDINTLDYNALGDCWKQITKTESCLSSSDFNKDGVIDQIDYNTYLRGFATWIKQGK